MIAVDDGSTDDSGKILDEYAKYDKRIKVIHQENSGSAGAARQIALPLVTGQYVQMLDADDYFSFDLLETVKKRIDETNADIVLPVMRSVDIMGNILHEILPPGGDYTLCITGVEAFMLSLDWTIHGCMSVLAVLLKKIGYETQLMNRDEFTTRKLFHNAGKIVFAVGVYFYFANENSTTKRKEPRIQAYHPLLTTYNLYKYAKSFPELSHSVDVLANEFAASLVGYEIKYLREFKELNLLCRASEVDFFLKKVFEETILEVLRSVKNIKYKIFYLSSFNNFWLFKFYCRAYLLLVNIKKMF